MASASASVVVELMKDRFGIGFSSIGYRTSEVRPVPLATVKGGRYVEPTFETAMDGSYPSEAQSVSLYQPAAESRTARARSQNS